MKRKIWFSAGLLVLSLGLAGCADVLKQLNQMAALTKCQFRLASVQNTSLAGVPIQSASKGELNPLTLLKVQQAFSTGTLPLQFTLNIEAKNPNASSAGMSRLEWIALVDGSQLTSGVLEQTVTIPPNGGVGTLPLVVHLDLKKALSGKSLDSLLNLALNIAGEGQQPTHVTLKLKPSIRVGTQTLLYPDYVTVDHQFGAAK